MVNFIFGFITGLFLVFCGAVYYGYKEEKKNKKIYNDKNIVITLIGHED